MNALLPLVLAGILQGQASVRPIWELEAAETAVSPADRTFVAALDEAWCAGDPRRVLALLDPIHPQLRAELLARVLSTTGGRPCRRRSKILAVHERRGFRTLFLSVRTHLQDPETGEPRKQAIETFEIAVLAPGPAPRRARILVETSAAWQAHVVSRVRGREPLGGPPLGPAARFRCPICNYEVGAPAEGLWFVTTRPPFLSGCLEEVEVYALEKDLMLELSIQPSPGPHSALRRLLENARRRLAQAFGVEPPRAVLEPANLGGASGFQTRLEIPATSEHPARRFLLYILAAGRVGYVLSVQGSPRAADPKAPDVAALLGTFKVLAPDRDPRSVRLDERHGGGGRFEGARFVHDSLGFSVAGPAGWEPFRRMGPLRLQVGWRCPRSGSFLLVAALDRPKGGWTSAAAKAWLDAWIRGHRGPPTGLEDFRVQGPPKSGHLAGRPLWTLDYSYVDPVGRPGASGRVRGRIVLVPIGPARRTLLLLRAEARPAEGQAANWRRLGRALSSLELAD